jgi:hypothetical protein
MGKISIFSLFMQTLLDAIIVVTHFILESYSLRTISTLFFVLVPLFRNMEFLMLLRLLIAVYRARFSLYINIILLKLTMMLFRLLCHLSLFKLPIAYCFILIIFVDMPQNIQNNTCKR